MGFEAHDLQTVKVQDVSNDELSKKELNDKATALHAAAKDGHPAKSNHKTEGCRGSGSWKLK